MEDRMVRRLFVVWIAASVALIAGCGNDKKEALKGLEQIKAACDDNEKDLAKKIAEDLRAKNKIFEKAFSTATDGNPSPNFCSPLLHNQITTMIQHGS
jgi:hypothetical protein